MWLETGTMKNCFYVHKRGNNRMWEDYVYDKNKKEIRIGKKGDQNDFDVIYLGRFLSWEEANDYFKVCEGDDLCDV